MVTVTSVMTSLATLKPGPECVTVSGDVCINNETSKSTCDDTWHKCDNM